MYASLRLQLNLELAPASPTDKARSSEAFRIGLGDEYLDELLSVSLSLSPAHDFGIHTSSHFNDVSMPACTRVKTRARSFLPSLTLLSPSVIPTEVEYARRRRVIPSSSSSSSPDVRLN